MSDPILFALALRFRCLRLVSRRSHTAASGLPIEGVGIAAVGSTAEDACVALLARWRAARGGDVDA